MNEKMCLVWKMSMLVMMGARRISCDCCVGEEVSFAVELRGCVNIQKKMLLGFPGEHFFE